MILVWRLLYKRNDYRKIGLTFDCSELVDLSIFHILIIDCPILHVEYQVWMELVHFQ